MSTATATRSTAKKRRPIDWDGFRRDLMRRIGIKKMFEALGVRFVDGAVTNERGWHECFALGRNDKKASAACCVELDGDKPGHYTDLGGDKSQSVWDMTIEVLGLDDFMDAMRHWAKVAVVELPSSPAGRSKTKAKSGKADGEKSEFVTFVPKPQSIGVPFGIWAKTKRWKNYPRADVVALLKAIGCEVGRIWGVDCIAFPVTESGADGDVVGRMLYRVDGQDFEHEERREKTRYDQLSGHGFFIAGRDADGNIVRGSAALAACKVIIWVEGPTDLVALMLHSPAGYAVATSSNGASKRGRESNLTEFAGKEVFVVGDADDAGQAGAERAAKSIAADAARVVLVSPLFEMQANHGKDVRDWFDEGKTFDELLAAMQQGRVVDPTEAIQSTRKGPAGEAGAARDDGTDDDAGCVSNGMQLGEGGGFLPATMEEITSNISKRTGDWPRSSSGRLFYVEDDEFKFIRSNSQFWGYLGLKTGRPAKFYRVAGAHSKEEVFCVWEQKCPRYSAIEKISHWPPIKGVFYMRPQPSPGDGTTLERLLDFFSPETLLDRDLLKLSFVTPYWGGPGGKRPVFILTASGRGQGKTTVAKMVGKIYGTPIEMSPNESIPDLKLRLLSDEASFARVIILDNLKSTRFSWADFEGHVTSLNISGRKLYVGEASRPNLFTYFITANGVSLSRDMSQRSVVIRLLKPTYSGNWEADVERFIDQNREQILADVLGYLMQPPVALKTYSRWGEWEQSVLSKLPEPSEAQALILERQRAVDSDFEDSQNLEEVISEKLSELYYDPDKELVFIPSKHFYQWYGEAVGDRYPNPNKASSRLKQAIEEGLITRLSASSSHKKGRGWCWRGVNTEQDAKLNYDLELRIEKQRKAASSFS